MLAEFSKLKMLQSPNFMKFRDLFQAKLEKMFVVPANTFDNVKGQFPIGFMIWNTQKQESFKQAISDVFDNNGVFIEQKSFYSFDSLKLINDWIFTYTQHKGVFIGNLSFNCNDFQHQAFTRLWNFGNNQKSISNFSITNMNIIPACIYFAVRKVIPSTWLNDRDQFLYPNDGWKTDEEFKSDCLTYALFNNNIQSKYGINHWIPFTEYQVGARDKFDSNFMTDFFEGKTENDNIISEPVLFYGIEDDNSGGGADKKPNQLDFSETAKNVFKAGKELWKHYHAQPKCNVNASLYDIREYFQERNDKGKMNNKSNDETYNGLIDNLRIALKVLAKKIEPKVYEYGFLRE